MTEIVYQRRNLPHIYSDTGTYCITLRLAGSLPKEAIELYREVKHGAQISNLCYKDLQVILKYNELLDGRNHGPKHLANSNAAEIVRSTLNYPDGKEYKLICFCIMPNHVHLIFSLLEGNKGLSKILQSMKRISARK